MVLINCYCIQVEAKHLDAYIIHFEAQYLQSISDIFRAKSIEWAQNGDIAMYISEAKIALRREDELVNNNLNAITFSKMRMRFLTEVVFSQRDFFVDSFATLVEKTYQDLARTSLRANFTVYEERIVNIRTFIQLVDFTRQVGNGDANFDLFVPVLARKFEEVVSKTGLKIYADCQTVVCKIC